MSEHKYSYVPKSGFLSHFRATDLAALIVVRACSSEEEFKALAMRLAACCYQGLVGLL